MALLHRLHHHLLRHSTYLQPVLFSGQSSTDTKEEKFTMASVHRSWQDMSGECVEVNCFAVF